MKLQQKILIIGVILAILICTVGVAAADDDDDDDGFEDTGGLKLEIDTVTDGANWGTLEVIMPYVTLVFTAILLIYGITLLVGPLAAGTKLNMATILKSNDLRSEGFSGIIHIVGGLLMVCISIIIIIYLWNNYGPGSWG